MELPPPERLAALVSSVTQTMCGMSFSVSPVDASGNSWRTAALAIEAQPHLMVALSTDQAGCAALGSAMFGMSVADLDTSMMEDALRELVNMTAGQIKRALALDDALGLPKILTSPTDFLKTVDQPKVLNTPLAAGPVKMTLWIAPKGG